VQEKIVRENNSCSYDGCPVSSRTFERLAAKAPRSKQTKKLRFFVKGKKAVQRDPDRVKQKNAQSTKNHLQTFESARKVQMSEKNSFLMLDSGRRKMRQWGRSRRRLGAKKCHSETRNRRGQRRVEEVPKQTRSIPQRSCRSLRPSYKRN